MGTRQEQTAGIYDIYDIEDIRARTSRGKRTWWTGMGTVAADFLELCGEHEMVKNYAKHGKYPINDISIPLVKYPEIDAEDCIAIHDIAEEVLRRAKENNDSNEVSALYALGTPIDRKECCAYVNGDEHGTDLGTNADAFHLLYGKTENGTVLVNVHNHPGGTEISFDDIVFLLRNLDVKMIVIIPNKNDGLYFLEKLADHDPSRSFDVLREAVKKNAPHLFEGEGVLTFEESASISKDFTRQCPGFGMHYGYAAKDRSLAAMIARQEGTNAKIHKDYIERGRDGISPDIAVLTSSGHEYKINMARSIISGGAIGGQWEAFRSISDIRIGEKLQVKVGKRIITTSPVAEIKVLTKAGEKYPGKQEHQRKKHRGKKGAVRDDGR